MDLGDDEGLAIAYAASLDNLLAFPKSMPVRRMGALGASRRHKLWVALMTMGNC